MAPQDYNNNDYDTTPLFSAQGLISCGSRITVPSDEFPGNQTYTGGCASGAFPTNVFEYLQTYGAAWTHCNPVVTNGGNSEDHFEVDGGDVPACKTQCQDGSAMNKFKIGTLSPNETAWMWQGDYPNYVNTDATKHVAGELDMANLIAKYGVVMAAFNVRTSFGTYNHRGGDIYTEDTASRSRGYHAVACYGWGTRENTKYVPWASKGPHAVVDAVLAPLSCSCLSPGCRARAGSSSPQMASGA